MSIATKIKKLRNLTRKGKQNPDGTINVSEKPLTASIGGQRPLTMEERLKRILADHKRQMIEDKEYRDETDFDIDEPDMLSPYEKNNEVFELAQEDLSIAKQTPPSVGAEGGGAKQSAQTPSLASTDAPDTTTDGTSQTPPRLAPSEPSTTETSS